MLKKGINRYNTLLRNFMQKDEFIELLSLALEYHETVSLDERRAGVIPADNPYQRLIKDIENRENI